jgi:hypothetical protein
VTRAPDDKLKSMWKGEIMVYFKVEYQPLAAGCGGSHDKIQSGNPASGPGTDPGTLGIFEIN